MTAQNKPDENFGRPHPDLYTLQDAREGFRASEMKVDSQYHGQQRSRPPKRLCLDAPQMIDGIICLKLSRSRLADGTEFYASCRHLKVFSLSYREEEAGCEMR